MVIGKTMGTLNLMQKHILIVGVMVIVLMGLFPPWACGTQAPAPELPVFESPQGPYKGFGGSTAPAPIDTTTIIMLIFVMLAVVCLIFFFKSLNKERWVWVIFAVGYVILRPHFPGWGFFLFWMVIMSVAQTFLTPGWWKTKQAEPERPEPIEKQEREGKKE